MQLGIVATRDQFGARLVGLASAAAARGWSCRCFLTDRGVMHIHSAPFLALARSGKIRVDVCEYSWERYGDGSHPDGVTMSSQYQNAELAHQCDKVIVL
jgi:peroxiredoxin family protein